jgi:uncharacterized protein (DUF2235 family)
MPRNILIFADGTGNEGGLIPDESRTNVYKLYRATRTGPDSNLDPNRQIAFYIRGIGTPTASVVGFWRGIWGRFQQMIGAGLTSRIVDCYAAIISVWQPGDRIYLFGFSRGAYTIRCVAHVLELAGIPTKANGKPLSLEPTALRGVAKAGVRTMYVLGLPVKNLDKRKRNLEAFRAKYECVIGAGTGAIPYFVGVWDTVAALGWSHFAASKLIRKLPFLSANYDMHFVPDIPFARHAMAIDEYRRDFVRVPWGGSGTVMDGDIAGVTRFRQVWFAGNHADIGGSYPENESRLSDIALKWMTDFISKEIPDADARISINEDFLNVRPSYDGMMHDELMVGHGPAHKIHFWPAGERKVDPNGELHETVLNRFGLASVRNYTGYGPYRPKSLEEHPKAKQFYKNQQPAGAETTQSS